jgi:DHA3 family macrolide efflux protein-like MFS transporter
MRRLRVAKSPYVRLARNRGFAVLWSGQLVSLFGDRIHQTAMVMLIVGLGASPLALASVFVAAALPAIVLGPLLGSIVDRVDQRRLLVGLDVLRAVLVASIPFIASVSFWYVLPVLLVMGTASAAFNPARFAIVARSVDEDDLVAANASLMIEDTLADVAGYPIAAAIVVLLANHLPYAFYIDSLSYAVSALAIAMASIRPRPSCHDLVARPSMGSGVVQAWQFLRREPALFANTLQGVFGQASTGVAVVLMPLYAVGALAAASGLAPAAALGAEQTGLGVGCVIGSLVVGAVAHRVRKGRLIVAGYIATGLLVFLYALSGSLVVAIPIVMLGGATTMAYIIPSQALFGQRVPDGMMGRVIAIRTAGVSAAYLSGVTAAGVLGATFGLVPVLCAAGLMSAAIGGVGLFFPQVRRVD